MIRDVSEPDRPSAQASSPPVLAFVPARRGSRRVPGKNIRTLRGHPLLAYTIAAARGAGLFDTVIVSTDSEEVAAVARHYGAEVPFLRPTAFAGDQSPDIEWLEHALTKLRQAGRAWDAFALLRPTSPFRTTGTIQRAWQQFLDSQDADSLRAVELCEQHPGKMWIVNGNRMTPLLTSGPKDPPWHSTPYQALPPVYVQNASLEVAWTRVVLEQRSIAGEVLVPFLTEGYEGFDINTPYDWTLAEQLVTNGDVSLPLVPEAPFIRQDDHG